tara:strand:+ start:1451 stop:3154 length:1704 start_codon:yes stop_codon:yes gene_type:complete
MDFQTSQNNFDYNHPLRPPSVVMKLDRLGSFHQTRLSFARRLIDDLKCQNCKIDIHKWNIDYNGIGSAIIKIALKNETLSLVIFCHSISDEERTDRVIAEKWDMTFSLFRGIPNKNELNQLSKNLKIQESGRHNSKQLTLSRANKSQRIFEKVLNDLSVGKQPSKKLINEVGYLIRTTAVYGNGKFGIGDFSNNDGSNFLEKPFQAEMLTVYLVRYFSIKLINFLAKKKGGKKSVTLSKHLTKHLGVGNATGLGMAPFLVNHQELIHQWIYNREKALSRVFSIKRLDKKTQNKIIDYIHQAFKYSSQWKVDDKLQSKKIEELNLDLKKILQNENLTKLLNFSYPIKKFFDFFKDDITLETQEILNSIFIEPFPELLEDLVNNMGVEEKKSVLIGYTVNDVLEIIKNNFNWALKIDTTKPEENYCFWYTSQTKLEPRLGITKKDTGIEKQLPFDIAHQIKQAVNILNKLPSNMTAAEVMINQPELRNIIKRIIINKSMPYSEIQNNLIGKNMKPIDILRCKLSFFGASKFDPKSNLWTRITLFQGAPLPSELWKTNVNDWLFPNLSNV